MVELDKEAFKISFDLFMTKQKLERLVKDSGSYHETHFVDQSVLYMPYWFFSYNIFIEENGKVIKKLNDYNALNSSKQTFEKDIAELRFLESVARTKKTSHSFPIKVLVARIKENEAREIIAGEMAHKNKVRASDILISSLNWFYIPFWIITMQLDGKTIEFRVNAISGDVLNEDIVEKKDVSEGIFSEVLGDLMNPSKWGEYLDFSKKESSKKHSKTADEDEFETKPRAVKANITSNPDFTVLFLAILAIIVIIWVAYL